jgi:hypothetical protein
VRRRERKSESGGVGEEGKERRRGEEEEGQEEGEERKSFYLAAIINQIFKISPVLVFHVSEELLVLEKVRSLPLLPPFPLVFKTLTLLVCSFPSFLDFSSSLAPLPPSLPSPSPSHPPSTYKDLAQSKFGSRELLLGVQVVVILGNAQT